MDDPGEPVPWPASLPSPLAVRPLRHEAENLVAEATAQDGAEGSAPHHLLASEPVAFHLQMSLPFRSDREEAPLGSPKLLVQVAIGREDLRHLSCPLESIQESLPHSVVECARYEIRPATQPFGGFGFQARATTAD
jgi:hypothetical protein